MAGRVLNFLATSGGLLAVLAAVKDREADRPASLGERRQILVQRPDLAAPMCRGAKDERPGRYVPQARRPAISGLMLVYFVTSGT